MLISPFLLKRAVQWHRTRIFLCGPGLFSLGYDVRKATRDFLSEIQHTEIVYGEEIENERRFRSRRIDLQTLESEFAHSVYFTVLLLESPGSIAELDTFSMIPNLRGRLVVLVPEQFYQAKSYIARGPLSLLSKHFPTNVVYYRPTQLPRAKQKIQSLTTLYKFFSDILGHDYYFHISYGYKMRSYGADDYENLVRNARLKFIRSCVIISTLVIEEPTFVELMNETSLNANVLSHALHGLLTDGKIVKSPDGRYRAPLGYADPELERFDTGRISQVRARRLAMA